MASPTVRRVALVAALSVALFLSYCAGVGSSIAKEEALSAARRQNTEEKVLLSKVQMADTVWYVCEWSRQSTDGPSEEHCGYLQDAYQMEYLCKERNALPSNQCWVEDTSVSPQTEVETI